MKRLISAAGVLAIIAARPAAAPAADAQPAPPVDPVIEEPLRPLYATGEPVTPDPALSCGPLDVFSITLLALLTLPMRVAGPRPAKCTKP